MSERDLDAAIGQEYEDINARYLRQKRQPALSANRKKVRSISCLPVAVTMPKMGSSYQGQPTAARGISSGCMGALANRGP